MRLRRQYGRPAGAATGGIGDGLLGWLFLALLWDHAAGSVRVTVALVLVLIPWTIAGALVYRCSAWRVTEHTRCEQRRPGPFRRCADHAGQVVTAHDVAAVICVLVGLALGVAALVR